MTASANHLRRSFNPDQFLLCYWPNSITNLWHFPQLIKFRTKYIFYEFSISTASPLHFPIQHPTPIRFLCKSAISQENINILCIIYIFHRREVKTKIWIIFWFILGLLQKIPTYWYFVRKNKFHGRQNFVPPGPPNVFNILTE